MSKVAIAAGVLLPFTWQIATSSAQVNLVSNGEFTEDADGWALINHPLANWWDWTGYDGNPGVFWINDTDVPVPPETSQLITGLSVGDIYTVSGYYQSQDLWFDGPSFRVLMDDTVMFEGGETEVTDWTYFSFNYEATSATVLLRFQAQVGSDSDYSIDGIRMVNAAVPAVSEWGMVAMSLLVLTAGTLVYAQRRPARA